MAASRSGEGLGSDMTWRQAGQVPYQQQCSGGQQQRTSPNTARPSRPVADMLIAVVAAVEAREELWRSERLYSASMAALACQTEPKGGGKGSVIACLEGVATGSGTGGSLVQRSAHQGQQAVQQDGGQRADPRLARKLAAYCRERSCGTGAGSRRA